MRFVSQRLLFQSTLLAQPPHTPTQLLSEQRPTAPGLTRLVPAQRVCPGIGPAFQRTPVQGTGRVLVFGWLFRVRAHVPVSGFLSERIHESWPLATPYRRWKRQRIEKRDVGSLRAGCAIQRMFVTGQRAVGRCQSTGFRPPEAERWLVVVRLQAACGAVASGLVPAPGPWARLVPWCIGPLAMANRCRSAAPGALVQRSIGALVSWSIGAWVHYRPAAINTCSKLPRLQFCLPGYLKHRWLQSHPRKITDTHPSETRDRSGAGCYRHSLSADGIEAVEDDPGGTSANGITTAMHL